MGQAVGIIPKGAAPAGGGQALTRWEGSIVQATNAAASYNLDGSVQAGDRLIVWRGTNNTTYAAIAAPTLAGVTFEEISPYAGSGTRPHLRCWAGVLVAGGGQTVTCPQVGAATHNNLAAVLQGAATLAAGADPDAGQMGSNEGLHTAPALVVTSPAYLRYAAVQSRSAGAGNYDLPADWTLVAEVTGSMNMMVARRLTYAAAQDFVQQVATWDQFAGDSSAWVAP